jgi:hypothetical protein
VRGDPVGGDWIQAGVLAVGVDPLDERLDRLGTGEQVVLVAGAADAGEGQLGMLGQLGGGEQGLGDRFDDPPVAGGQVGVALAFGGGDSRCAVVLRDAVVGDRADYWWRVCIPTMRYSSSGRLGAVLIFL